VAFIPMHGDEPVKAVDWSNPDTQWTEFVGGLQMSDGSRATRPTGVAVGPKGDLFVSDDKGGKIYRIRPASK
jgi:glucose/arabinose dehydrogenase